MDIFVFQYAWLLALFSGKENKEKSSGDRFAKPVMSRPLFLPPTIYGEEPYAFTLTQTSLRAKIVFPLD